MDLGEIKKHWENWASAYGQHLRATTKTWTIKALEIDALSRTIKKLVGAETKPFDVLEAGCGNGVNMFELANQFVKANFDGFDYVAEMITAAEKNKGERKDSQRFRFFTGDVAKIAAVGDLKSAYDVVFTDRCLINLNTPDLQKNAISGLAAKVRKGGHLLLLENIKQTYDSQNKCRELLGLTPRTPASFNLFFDEQVILPHIKQSGLEVVNIEDFGSLHDLVLYVLLPALKNGEVDYENPLVEKATILSKAISAQTPSAFGAFGQNRLYICRKS